VNHLEAKIQASIVQYLQILGIFCFSCPNERKASPQAMGRLISMGLRPGVSDLILWLGDKTVYMEVKTPKGKQSEAQKRFQKRCEESGRIYCVVHSLDEAMKVVDEYGKEG
jgi:hypothetical protein